jgi:SAM-dependent MidA family methyltransferase
VEFGGEPHFWTYPRLLSPIFGWALAERIRETAACWTELGLLSAADSFTILELGGGDGCLARDVLDYVVAHALEPEWRQLAGRLEYVIGELSPSLRIRQEFCLQRHIDAGRARVFDCDARNLSWPGSFKGLVFCNELIDALPVERLRVHGADQAVSRVHVEQIPQGSNRSIAEESLVPLSAGWMNEDGAAEEPPTPLLEYLHSLRPLITDLDACELLPVDLYWPPSLSEFIRRLSELLTQAGNVGAVLLVDYGGTSRHVLDPRSLGPHLRVYGADRELAHATDVYVEPGLRDMTCDVDFTEVARLARGFGLDVSFFAHQSAIDTGYASPEETDKLEALGVRLSREVGYAPSVARLVAPYVLKRFRRSPCYWLMQLSPHHLPAHNVMTSSEMQPDGKALWTLANSVGRQQLENALGRAELQKGIASRLKPCGDIAADLSDAGMLEHYRAVMRLLESHRWLRPPGAVGT